MRAPCNRGRRRRRLDYQCRPLREQKTQLLFHPPFEDGAALSTRNLDLGVRTAGIRGNRLKEHFSIAQREFVQQFRRRGFLTDVDASREEEFVDIAVLDLLTRFKEFE